MNIKALSKYSECFEILLEKIDEIIRFGEQE